MNNVSECENRDVPGKHRIASNRCYDVLRVVAPYSFGRCFIVQWNKPFNVEESRNKRYARFEHRQEDRS